MYENLPKAASRWLGPSRFLITTENVWPMRLFFPSRQIRSESHPRFRPSARTAKWVLVAVLGGCYWFANSASAQQQPAAPAQPQAPAPAPAQGLAQSDVASANGETEPSIPVPAKVDRYAKRVVRRYDTNGDGRLDATEWGKMGGNPASADTDRDGFLTETEYARYVTDYGQRRRIRLLSSLFHNLSESPRLLHPSTVSGAIPTETAQEEFPRNSRLVTPLESPSATESADPFAAQKRFHVNRLPSGLPDWFAQRDANGDGQLTLAEFTPEQTPSAIEEFRRYDTDRDGLLTPKGLLAFFRSQKGAAKKEAQQGAQQGTPKPDAATTQKK